MEKLTRLSRRATVRLVSFGLTLFIVVAAFAATGWYQASVYQRYIENNYQYAFTELVTAVNSIDTALQKGSYSRSPSLMVSLSSEIFRQSAVAQAAMSGLPFSFSEMEQTAKFLSQAGDFVHALARKTAGGAPPTEEELKALRQLSETASQLAGALSTLQAIINEESLRVGEVLQSEQQMSAVENGIPVTAGFKELESEFPEFPTLIYDGPFSGHIEKKEPEMLKNLKDVSMEDAKAKAADFLEIDPSWLKYGGMSEGRIPTYTFYASLDGGEVSVDITVRGGFVLNLTNSRTVQDKRISAEEALQRAREFLVKMGYPDMKESYWMLTGSALVANFAYAEHDVVCYPDLIQVGIALDTGKVVQFVSTGYLMNHRDTRTFPMKRISWDEAKARVADGLTIEDGALCVIPSEGQNELFCYEFKCRTNDGVTYLVYLNAVSGVEERILIVLEDENGTLTM